MIKPYEELVKIDVTKHCEQREGMDYLNWAKCISLLHEHGAEKVYFEPLTNENGSSLFMSDVVFKDKNGTENRCYEIGVKVVVDDDTWEFRGPLMNGANPVKDNSMSQQRVWNAQTRAFVKCIAIHTGLGFNLWIKGETEEAKGSWEDDPSKHSLKVIKSRLQELITAKMQNGVTFEEIAKKINSDPETIRGCFSYFTILENLEKSIENIDKSVKKA